ncbi:aspartate/glutamate racemase family protein [Asticcacaulis sp. ZE23SCel15]|uniref:glutamate racemase n=1 Tax=Asticcacaulis sp. ZE23SCel15 TaxID=3059027 RepID=UPI00265E5264|nr:aspartate/glutamate racemase family protein [Asticcacaulis sp. ZE23SCel15]WKL57979.1 aspartate/glutamate racemase family protein [Asticcacaulis sp. ZE23SCel15]
MAIGVFDSGVGGLTIHRALVERLPSADFVYLADQKHAPYGERTGEDIVNLTRQGCETLFDQGASLVILACNTASAVALRRLQSTWLSDYRKTAGRPVNVLGIIVPTIEAATGVPWEHEAERRGPKIENLDILGLFCTRATAHSRVYEIEIDKRRQDLAVFAEPCPGLADMIEQGADHDALKAKIDGHVGALKARIGRFPDRAILGCTHYEIVADLFKAALPAGTPLIHQPSSVAEAMGRYVERHTEFDIGSSGKRVFLTTGEPKTQSALIETFWGAPLNFAASQVAAA